MDFSARFIAGGIAIVVLLILGLGLHFVTEYFKKKKPAQWEEFAEKVEDFNEKHTGNVSEGASAFLEKHVNDSQASHARYLLKHDENYRKEIEQTQEK